MALRVALSPAQIVFGATVTVGFAPKVPPTKSSRDAVMDCEDLASSRKLAKQ